MQYNHRVVVSFTTEFDEYGEAKVTDSKEMRCCILSETLVNKTGESSNYAGNATAISGTPRKNKYDLTILVNAKSYVPYSKLFDDNQTTILSSERTYSPKVVTKINGTGGKAKYYQIELEQVRR